MFYGEEGPFNMSTLSEVFTSESKPNKTYTRTFSLRMAFYIDVWDMKQNTTVDGEWYADITWSIPVR